MRLLVVAVGKVKGPLAPVVAEYERRAARYWKLEVEEVDAGARLGSQDSEAVMTAEAGRLLARVPDELELIALTRGGKEMGSEELSGYLQERALRSAAGVAFVIGGAHGLAQDVLTKARRRLSLSAMTLPHEVARLVLAEQLYRAGTIARGEPYHKG
ncbi:MAG: 23S rRNA (pseudouridine(1915)-N(3))-methyltransferase RlmH [Gemmatimonadetes bacterium]|nr:23S rRNA (pseudouridine(1915)-N(3))-methyltransferase RlmH [Gemmatimonadota bacterium]